MTVEAVFFLSTLHFCMARFAASNFIHSTLREFLTLYSLSLCWGLFRARLARAVKLSSMSNANKSHVLEMGLGGFPFVRCTEISRFCSSRLLVGVASSPHPFIKVPNKDRRAQPSLWTSGLCTHTCWKWENDITASGRKRGRSQANT